MLNGAPSTVRMFAVMTLTSAMLMLSLGCPPRAVPKPLAPLSLRDAREVVHTNTRQIQGTLKATGLVRARLEGRSAGPSVDGYLLLHRPQSVRFELKSIAGTEALFGCNDQCFWYYQKREGDVYLCKPIRGDLSLERDLGIPLNPVQLMDALGLGYLPSNLHELPIRPDDPPRSSTVRVVQRIEPTIQQVLVIQDQHGLPIVEREYWLDRYHPRLVRRVQYRDAMGIIIMESWLDDYRQLGERGPWLPYKLHARWPATQAEITMQVDRWSILPEIKATAPAYLPPHMTGTKYDNAIIECP